MGQNLVGRHPTAAEWAEIDEAIARVQTLLAPVVVAVSPAEKRALVKMGDGSAAFCQQAADVMEENIALMPRSFDVAEMRRDLQTHDALDTRLVKLVRLVEQVRDTEIAIGSDAMVAALEGYAVLKAVGRGDSVQALTRQLGRRFEQAPREAAATPA